MTPDDHEATEAAFSAAVSASAPTTADTRSGMDEPWLISDSLRSIEYGIHAIALGVQLLLEPVETVEVAKPGQFEVIGPDEPGLDEGYGDPDGMDRAR
jgi:hypothetical protein